VTERLVVVKILHDLVVAVRDQFYGREEKKRSKLRRLRMSKYVLGSYIW
jgi:hypothetical protein